MTEALKFLRAAWPYLLTAAIGFGVAWHWRTADLANLRVTIAEMGSAADKVRADSAESNLKLERDRNANNEALRHEYDEKVAAADERASDLSRRLFAAFQNPARQGGVPAGGGVPGADAAAAFASRTAELERAVARYDSACQSDAAQLGALIAQIRPQL